MNLARSRHQETQCGVIQRHGFGTCNSVFPGKEHELERGGLLFKIKKIAYRLGRNKEEPEGSDNLSAAAALFELRAGEERVGGGVFGSVGADRPFPFQKSHPRGADRPV